MKFVLFICISLLASMLHAVAMPIGHTGSNPTEAETVTMTMDHTKAHCDKSSQDKPKAKNHCPDNGTPCCFGVTLQPIPLITLTAPDRQVPYPSLSPRLFRHAPDTLFKPPKLYPLVAG